MMARDVIRDKRYYIIQGDGSTTATLITCVIQKLIITSFANMVVPFFEMWWVACHLP